MILPQRPRVFLSFIAEDRNQVNGLRLLASNENYDLEFFDESLRRPIDSTNEEYIKRILREKISRSSVTLCLISEQTHTSKWVEWELRVSREKGNRITAMAVKGLERAILPAPIREWKIPFLKWDPEFLSKELRGSN